MSKRARRNHAPALKAKVTLSAVKGEKSLVELAHQFDIHPNQITTWKPCGCYPGLLRRPGALARQLGDGAAEVFGSEPEAGLAAPAVDVSTLDAKVGELTLINDFFVRRAGQGRPSETQSDDRRRPSPVHHEARQGIMDRSWRCVLLSCPVYPECLAVMQRIDELHLELPFAGSRMLPVLLSREGVGIGHRHVATLMKRMRIEALYRKPNTSKPTPGRKIYPYLLRGVTVRRPDQACEMDTTYMPMARGFVYLAAVVDCYSRRVLSWRPSITMEAAISVEALEETLVRHGKQDIFNTDQGAFRQPGVHRRPVEIRRSHQHGRQKSLEY